MKLLWLKWMKNIDEYIKQFGEPFGSTMVIKEVLNYLEERL